VRRRRATANRTLTILKAALNHAFAHGKVASDSAWRRVRPFREADAARIRYLAPDECQRLIDGADPAFRPLVQAALATGCRYGELIALRGADIDEQAGTLLIRASKSGKARHVALRPDGVALFRQLARGKQAKDLLLTHGDGRAWRKSHQARPLIAASKCAGIDPPVHFHALRHTSRQPPCHGGRGNVRDR